MPKANTKKVGVINGGTSHEREKSVLYGKTISKIFRDAGNNVVEIHLHPNGSWTRDGKVENLENALVGLENVWNALVGEDGEHGLVEKLCHKCHVKILGHKSLHTDLAADKKKIKDVLNQHKIKSPYSKTLSPKNINSEELKFAFQMVGLPLLLKPINGIGGKNIFYVNNFAQYTNAVENIFQLGKEVLVEKPIEGKHISCFVFSHKGLLHCHVYSDEKLERDEFLMLRNEALFIYNTLAFQHHIKLDFVLKNPPNPPLNKGGATSAPIPYLIEVNTHPSLTHAEVGDIFKKGEISLSEYLLGKIN